MKQIVLLISVASTMHSFAQKTGIGTGTPTNLLQVEATVAAPAVASLQATNTGASGTAIWGSANASGARGITGSSAKGFGVQGYSNNNIAVSGFSLGGIALSANSNNGYALQVSGNLKLSGGNTNPTAGAVLTSDATGNASWKKQRVAFLAVQTPSVGFVDGVFKKVEFTNKQYDLQSNFLDYNSGTTPASSSMFTAPVAGVYHFSSSITFSRLSGYYFYFYYADMKLVKNTSSTALAVYRGIPLYQSLIYTNSEVNLQLNGDFHLDAGDKVWIEALQSNQSGTTEKLEGVASSARFSGHLVVAD